MVVFLAKGAPSFDFVCLREELRCNQLPLVTEHLTAQNTVSWNTDEC